MNKENNELKKAGLKATLPRIRILEALDSCLLYTSDAADEE